LHGAIVAAGSARKKLAIFIFSETYCGF